MITKNYSIQNVDVSPTGFQGFEPITEAEATKIRAAFPGQFDGADDLNGCQKANFVSTTTVQDTDDDAGDGNPITYDKISYTKNTLYALQENISPFMTYIREPADLTDVGFLYNKGIMLVAGTLAPFAP